MNTQTRMIRAMHPYAFRSGRWATVEGTIDHANGRRCYIVRFPDGMSDFWPVDDEAHEYEFWPVRSGGSCDPGDAPEETR